MVRAGIRSTRDTDSATSSAAIIQLVSSGRGFPGVPENSVSTLPGMMEQTRILPVIQHEGFGKSIESEFRRVVRSAATEGVACGQAGNVDDESAAARQEPRQGLVRAIEGSVKIEIDISVPFLGRHLADFFKETLSGVVYKNVEAAKLAVHGSEESAHALHAPDVRRSTENPADAFSGAS